MNNNDKFKIRLKELRKEYKMTQQDLSKKLGLVRSAIANYETGRTNPDSETLGMIANIFNVSTDYLLGRTNIKTSEAFNDIDLAKQEDFEFNNAEEALRFILGQPSMMAYGGYDLKDIPEEEILEIANDILLTLRISIERRKNKK